MTDRDKRWRVMDLNGGVKEGWNKGWESRGRHVREEEIKAKQK